MEPQTRTRWSEAGALATAGTVAATILCCLPFATGVLGAGLAAVGARFAPLRPYLTGVSVACLGFAFYPARPAWCRLGARRATRWQYEVAEIRRRACWGLAEQPGEARV